jgi:bacterioferritin
MAKSLAVIKALNEALAEEIQAINQYFIHSELCEHWGLTGLHEKIRKESIDEMKHAEALIERILFLEGTPIISGVGELKIGKTVPELLEHDLHLEEHAISMYNRSIETCRKEDDNGSRALLDSILKDEEGHFSWIGTQIDLIKQIGLQNYLTEQMGKEE